MFPWPSLHLVRGCRELVGYGNVALTRYGESEKVMEESPPSQAAILLPLSPRRSCHEPRSNSTFQSRATRPPCPRPAPLYVLVDALKGGVS